MFVVIYVFDLIMSVRSEQNLRLIPSFRGSALEMLSYLPLSQDDPTEKKEYNYTMLLCTFTQLPLS